MMLDDHFPAATIRQLELDKNVIHIYRPSMMTRGSELERAY